MQKRDAALPRITVITPCRNGIRFIAEAIDSVVRQGYPALEHIVMDACSTDGTLTILARYPHLTVISEPDAGPHDAMNKALARATGDVIAFLNVDDLYPEGTLATVGAIFAANPDTDIVVGRSIYFEGDGSDPRSVFVQKGHAEEYLLWLAENAFGTPGFNGHFFRRDVMNRVGHFENSYRITGDRHFLLRAALERPRYYWLDRLVLLYRVHVGSATMNPQMSNLMPIGREHLRMAWEFVARAGAEPLAKRFFLDWHAFEGGKLLLRNTQRGCLGDAFHVFSEMFRRDPAWLFRLPRARRYNRFARRLYPRSTAPVGEEGQR